LKVARSLRLGHAVEQLIGIGDLTLTLEAEEGGLRDRNLEGPLISNCVRSEVVLKAEQAGQGRAYVRSVCIRSQLIGGYQFAGARQEHCALTRQRPDRDGGPSDEQATVAVGEQEAVPLDDI
jgi:hypothetical protein